MYIIDEILVAEYFKVIMYFLFLFKIYDTAAKVM